MLFGHFRYNNMSEFASKGVFINTYPFDFIKIISIPEENIFSKRPSDALLHTLSNLCDVAVGFATPTLPLFEALFLRSPKGHRGCYSTMDDLSCSSQQQSKF